MSIYATYGSRWIHLHLPPEFASKRLFGFSDLSYSFHVRIHLGQEVDEVFIVST